VIDAWSPINHRTYQELSSPEPVVFQAWPSDGEGAVGDPPSALTKLKAATSHLELAESLGAGDLWRLNELLRLAAEAIAAGE
jgi:hypothetical protein